MKIKRILSILLISTLALTAVGCGKSSKTNDENVIQTSTQSATVNKEEAFTTIPENNLVDDYVKDPSLQDKALLKDGIAFNNLYGADKPNPELISKYNLDYAPNTGYALTDLYKKYPVLFQIGMNSLFTQFHTDTDGYETFINKTLGTQTVNYLSDVWMNKKNDGYNLADEFKDKNPKEVFQKYLKDNNIKITDMTYPSKVTEYKALTGANYITVDATVKGTQNKKDFENTLELQFYFIPSKDIRTGVKKDDKLSDKDFEIRAVYLNPNDN